MNFLVDIGNTVLKAALSDGLTLGKTWRYQGENWCDFLCSAIKENIPEKVVVCSAREVSEELIRKIKAICEKVLVIDPVHCEVSSEYGIPDYITPDSVASIVAAREMFKGRKCSIFDFGTMIKYSFLDEEGKYESGCVSPGCTTRFRSVSRYARNLPLLSEDEGTALTGNSLDSSIRCGVVSGIVFEMEGYMKAFPSNICIFTGGDAIYFAKRTKNSIFVVCNLVLMGLAIIAERFE